MSASHDDGWKAKTGVGQANTELEAPRPTLHGQGNPTSWIRQTFERLSLIDVSNLKIATAYNILVHCAVQMDACMQPKN